MARLTLALFGTPQVALDGKPLAFAYHKAAALLTYLALEARAPHARGTLAALFWPDSPERVARQNLSQALTTLRSLLGERRLLPNQPPFLLADAETIQLNPVADWTVDVHQFRALENEIREHPHHALRTCVRCAERLQQLATLYSGDLLDQFVLRDSAPFEEWALMQREQLRSAAYVALEHLADSAEWHERYGSAVDYARRQIMLEPFRETGHRTLMRLLALNHQTFAALVHYDQLTRTLAREVGVLPEDDTTALRDSIRVAQLQPGILRRYLPPPMRVPARPTPLIGRDDDIQAVRRVLLEDAHPLVTIVGPPGIGKTSLAQTVTSGARFDFVDGVAFVELAPLMDPGLVPAAIAQVLDVAERPGEAVSRTLTETLGERHMLLALDNFEHVPDAAAVVVALLAACPALSILVTSRTPLGIDGEYLYALDTLTLPSDRGTAATVAASTAVQLFVERSQAVRPDFVLTSGNATVIGTLCSRLDGLPLAIELIAAQADVFAPEELLRTLDTRSVGQHDFGVESLADLPERQRTLQNAVSWSFNLLHDADRRVFAYLGVFAGGCTAEAVSAVVADEGSIAESLARLQHASLIRPDTRHAAPRYQVLASIRTFARDMLETTQMLEAARTQHTAYYAALVGDGRCNIAQLTTEYDNLLAAVVWAIEQDMPLAGLQLGVGLAQVWVRNRSWISGMAWLESIAARMVLPTAHNGATAPAQSSYLLPWIELQCTRAVAEGDAALLRQGRLALALLHQLQAHYGAAQGLFEAAISQPTTTADRFPLILLAELYGRMQNFERAYQLYLRCVTLNRDCRDAEGTADALSGLAYIALKRGLLGEAVAAGEEALGMYEQLEQQHGSARMLGIMGTISAGLGDHAAAVAHCCRSLLICHQLHDTAGCADALEALAPILHAQGRTALVIRVISTASALRRTDGTHRTPIEQAHLDDLLAQAISEVGPTVFAWHVQESDDVASEDLLRVIEEVQKSTDGRERVIFAGGVH